MPRFAVPLAFILLVIVALYVERNSLLGRGSFYVQEVAGRERTIMLTWRGGIEAPMAAELEKAFGEWEDAADTIVLNLVSEGGALREGGKVIDVIRDIKRTHRVETRVGDNRICLSMCVPIFLQGDYRVAGEGARFMFHQPISMDAVTGEVVDRPGFEQNFVSQQFFSRYFVNSPMDPAWREQLRIDWTDGDVWKTGTQLVNEGSNIIDALI